MPNRPLANFRINLNEIPDDGREFRVNRESGELNHILDDLIQERAYSVNVFIKPIGNAYEMTGRVETAVPEVCSKCGSDVDVPIHKDLREILIEQKGDDHLGHSVHGNGSVDFLNDATSAAGFQGGVFDLGEYIHEAIALAEPFYPSHAEGECEDLEEVARKREELERTFREADAKEGHPFSVLKGLNLNSPE